jgi:Holliday junction resolvasome RuvABC endonuclease subunit
MVKTLGIDLGMRKIALFYLGEQGRCHTARFEASENDSRDMQLLELGGYAHDICSFHDADSIWIEDVIIGNNRHYSLQLAQTLGAVMSSLAQLRLSAGTDIRLVDNKTWKKHLIGNGNASKDGIRNYIDVTHGAYAPLCEGDQDLYDACCVGLYGLGVTDRAEHLTL